MEAIFHLMFEIVKISILSCIYATVILLTFKIIGNYKPKSWFARISKKKLRLWFLSGLFISMALFFYMFTYYGDHGLGDSARIPIGHRREIQEVNGTQAYIQDKRISALNIDKFIISEDFVYGLTGNLNENYNGKYFVYDLIKNEVITFEVENDYLNFLTSKNLEIHQKYKDFSYYYKQHWNGWRLWFLP